MDANKSRFSAKIPAGGGHDGGIRHRGLQDGACCDLIPPRSFSFGPWNRSCKHPSSVLPFAERSTHLPGAAVSARRRLAVTRCFENDSSGELFHAGNVLIVGRGGERRRMRAVAQAPRSPMVSRTFASSSNTFVSALVVVGALTALVCGGPAAIAGTVVFGNLGPTGADGLDSTNTDMGPTATTVRALAQGFTTGSDAALLSIESVTIGAFAGATPVSRFVSIYSNDAGAGNVPGSKLFDSAAVSVSGQAKPSTSSTSAVSLSSRTRATGSFLISALIGRGIWIPISRIHPGKTPRDTPIWGPRERPREPLPPGRMD